MIFYRNVYSVVLYVSYDFRLVVGAAKRVEFLKMFKNLLLRNHKGDEAETWHICLGHWPLYKLCFYSCRIRTLVAMATYSFHKVFNGKIGN